MINLFPFPPNLYRRKNTLDQEEMSLLEKFWTVNVICEVKGGGKEALKYVGLLNTERK